MKKPFGGVKKVGNSHCLIVISNWLCALCVGLGLGLSCVWFGQQITQRQAAMTRHHGISKAGNSHYTKSTYVSPCVGLCVGLEPERPTPRQCGAMSTKQANCVKMGKDRMKGEKLTGVSQEGDNRPEQVGQARRFCLIAWWLWAAAGCCCWDVRQQRSAWDNVKQSSKLCISLCRPWG